MSIFLTPKVLKALEFAAISHDGQKRKGGDMAPYISHPYAVGLILSQAGFNEDVVIAGIFHDLIEDTNVTYEELQQKFGETIADLVLEVTEDKSLDFFPRKEKYLEHLKTATPEAASISAADLFANRLSMLNAIESGLDFWQNFKLGPKETFAFDRRRLEIIKSRTSHQFITEVETLVKELEKLSS